MSAILNIADGEVLKLKLKFELTLFAILNMATDALILKLSLNVNWPFPPFSTQLLGC